MRNYYTFRYVHDRMSAPTSSRQRILSEALDLFGRKGYDAASVREICQAAAITKPTLYHFFGSKDGVYRAIVDGALEDFRRTIDDAVQGEGTARARLRRVARGYFRNCRDRRELMRFLFAIIHNPPHDAPCIDFPRFYESVVARVAAVVEHGVEEGELAPGPTDVRMLAFMGALGEALCGFVLIGRPALTNGLADRLTDSILDGWVCRPGKAR